MTLIDIEPDEWPCHAVVFAATAFEPEEFCENRGTTVDLHDGLTYCETHRDNTGDEADAFVRDLLVRTSG